MDDYFDKEDKRFFVLTVIIILLIVGSIGVVGIIGFIGNYQKSMITDKRFTTGYTETIVSDSEKVYIQHPDKYEVQLDGDDWIEVTEQEYADSRINGHFQR